MENMSGKKSGRPANDIFPDLHRRLANIESRYKQKPDFGQAFILQIE